MFASIMRGTIFFTQKDHISVVFLYFRANNETSKINYG